MAQDVFQAAEPVDAPVATSRREVVVRKQGFTVYTAMLILSLICLLVGTLLMAIELRRYETIPPWKTGDATPTEVGQ
jgi:hypothetical protein